MKSSTSYNIAKCPATNHCHVDMHGKKGRNVGATAGQQAPPQRTTTARRHGHTRQMHAIVLGKLVHVVVNEMNSLARLIPRLLMQRCNRRVRKCCINSRRARTTSRGRVHNRRLNLSSIRVGWRYQAIRLARRRLASKNGTGNVFGLGGESTGDTDDGVWSRK